MPRCARNDRGAWGNDGVIRLRCARPDKCWYSFLGNLWVVFGQFLGNVWVTFGQPPPSETVVPPPGGRGSLFRRERLYHPVGGEQAGSPAGGGTSVRPLSTLTPDTPPPLATAFGGTMAGQACRPLSQDRGGRREENPYPAHSPAAGHRLWRDYGGTGVRPLFPLSAGQAPRRGGRNGKGPW